MIKFKFLEVIGFGSIINKYTFDLSYRGLTIIKGEVGSGKTTLMDAIPWVLFGAKTKNKSTVNPWPHLLDKSYKGTKCTLEFEKDGDSYQVVRCSEWKEKIDGKMGNNRLIIYRNGKPIDSNRDKNDVKLDIQTIIGYSPSLFKSSVLFGQRVKRFMEEDGPTRKKIMEEAFEIGHISKALLIAKKKYEDCTKDLRILTEKYDGLKKLLTVHTDALNSASLTIARFEESRLARIMSCNIEVEALVNTNKEIADRMGNRLDLKIQLSEAKAKLEKYQKRAEEVRNLKQELELSKRDLRLETIQLASASRKEKEIEKEIEEVPTNCEVCGNRLDFKAVKNTKRFLGEKLKDQREIITSTSNAIESIQSVISGMELSISSKSAAINKELIIKNKIEKLEDNIREYRDLEKTLENNQIRIKDLVAFREKIEEEKIEVDIDKIQQDIKQTKIQLKAVKPQVKGLKQEVKLLEWVIKDPLSNSGLKAFIFDSMLDNLNAKLSRYTSILGFKIKMGINLNSALKEFYVSITRNGDEIPSTDLSGGQTQLINLAIALSCHEVITSNKPTNLLIMDECFEGLGDREIDIVGDLLIGLTKNKSVYIVTHRNFSPTNSRLIEVEINKGVTKIFNR